MQSNIINDNWELTQGEPSNIPMMAAHGDKKQINVPYDFMIHQEVSRTTANGSEMGYYPGGIYTYTKQLSLTAEDLAGEVLVRFDGVFGHTRVIVNGNVAAHHTYGYTPFTVDIRPYCHAGNNRLAVVVNTACEKLGRWYSGAGIIRDVLLLKSDKVHIAPDGIQVYTRDIIGNDADIAVAVTVVNDSEEDHYLNLRTAFRLRQDVEAAASQDTTPDAEGLSRIFVKAHETIIARTTVVIPDASLWNPLDAHLYDVTSQIVEMSSREDAAMAEGQQEVRVLDSASTVFGVRTISVDAVHGLLINGRSVKLRGGCIHHDNGIIGAASYYDAEYRKVKRHRNAGFNALRFAHNPASSAMLEACDELGILTINEAFDSWNMPKNINDFSNEFATQWKTELDSMVIRDRNHPSVIFWSIGNELPEQGGLSDGYETSRRLAEEVRSLDSSRPVMGALCSFFNGLDDADNGRFWQTMMQEMAQQKNAAGGISNLDNSFGRNVWDDYTAPFAADWDVVGYNYLAYQFEPTHERFPDRVMLTSESKPAEFENYWKAVTEHSYVLGDFEWTSWDYIGEAAIGRNFYADKPEDVPAIMRKMYVAEYPCRTAMAGDFDLCGFVKPQLGFKRAVWGDAVTTILVHDPAVSGKIELRGRYGWTGGRSSWTWPVEAGTQMKVDVYSAAEEVELLINGVSQGRKAAGADNHYTAAFTVPYEAGILEAVSYTNGAEVSRASFESAGVASEILAVEENDNPDREIRFVDVTITDDNGIPEDYEERLLEASVEGGELLALGTGRGITEENYTAGQITSEQGRALAIVRPNEGDQCVLRVTADGLKTAEVIIH